jgi:hypothetical protein
MYTLIKLKRIIDTLPKYEKENLKIEGAENVNVCLEDVYDSLTEFEKQEFENWKNYGDLLDSIPNHILVRYLERWGYNVSY